MRFEILEPRLMCAHIAPVEITEPPALVALSEPPQAEVCNPVEKQQVCDPEPAERKETPAHRLFHRLHSLHMDWQELDLHKTNYVVREMAYLRGLVEQAARAYFTDKDSKVTDALIRKASDELTEAEDLYDDIRDIFESIYGELDATGTETRRHLRVLPSGDRLSR